MGDFYQKYWHRRVDIWTYIICVAALILVATLWITDSHPLDGRHQRHDAIAHTECS